MKNKIPNILTAIRIILSISILLISKNNLIYIIYFLCGMTDILDGFFARKFLCQTKFGEKFDSVADLTFVTVCCIKFLPTIEIPKPICAWIVAIIIIKILNILIGVIKIKKVIFLHTKLNKITGIVLFLFPLSLNFAPVKFSALILCMLATISAVDEMHRIIKKKLD